MILSSKIWSWSILIIIFALGAVTGAALDGLYRSQASNKTSYVIDRSSSDYFDSLKRELALNPEQSVAMNTIIEQMRAEYKLVCADVRPRYDELRERARQRMRSLLSTQQQQRFDLLVTKEDCNCPYLKK